MHAASETSQTPPATVDLSVDEAGGSPHFYNGLAGLAGFGLVLGLGVVAMVGVMDPPSSAKASLASQVESVAAAETPRPAASDASTDGLISGLIMAEPAAVPLYDPAPAEGGEAMQASPTAAAAVVSVPVAASPPAHRPGDSIFASY